jgi:undecaprenyl-diphosphatase
MLNMLYFYGLIALQIVTESFPVSSSGHLALWQRLWSILFSASTWDSSLYYDLQQQGMYELFVHLLHGPTLIAVGIVFFDRIKWYLRILYSTPCVMKDVLLFIGIADGITLFFYVLFKWVVVVHIPLVIGFCITALLLSSLYWCIYTVYRFSFITNAVVLGVVQGLSLLPGISRLGSTFVVACWLGFMPLQALELSWALQIPLICAAFLKSCVMMGMQHCSSIFWLPHVGWIIVGATICATLGLRLFKGMVENNYAWILSIYVMLIALITALV